MLEEAGHDGAIAYKECRLDAEHLLESLSQVSPGSAIMVIILTLET